jgi:hypothetical protein
MVKKLALFLTDFFRIIGIYFPSILLQLITVFVFIKLPQAYDLVTIYAEQENQSYAIYPVILAWSFISWYTARLVYYAYMASHGGRQSNGLLKFTRQELRYRLKNSFNTRTGIQLFKYVPRLIGLSVFFILSIVIICHCYFPINNKLVLVTAYVILILGIKWFSVYFIRKHKFRIYRTWRGKARSFRNIMAVSTILITLASTVISYYFHQSIKQSLIVTLILLVLIHLVFTLYMVFRRVHIYVKIIPNLALKQSNTRQVTPGWLDRILNFFSLPVYEKKLFRIFIFTIGILLCSHIFSCASLTYVRLEGLFAFAVGAFALLTAFGNLLTFFNFRVKINLHVLAILWVFMVGLFPLNHYGVHITNARQQHPFTQRTQLNVALDNWIDRNKTAFETEEMVPMFFVISDGGASRSAYWAASMMGKMEDLTNHAFSKRTFAISGASGGSVGNAVFYALLYNHYINQKSNHPPDELFEPTKEYLSNDFLSFPLSHYLGQDFITHIVPFDLYDRADALEYAMKHPRKAGVVEKILGMNLSELFCHPEVQKLMPVLYINTTRVQDSWPGVISSIQFDSLPATRRMDVLDSLAKWYNQPSCRKPMENPDMELVTASVMSSRFPYLSPAGAIGKNCFVDGGYFDNSGAGIVHETILSIEKLVKNDTTRYMRYFKKIKFYVIHFRNSPYTSSDHKNIHPLVNDLLAPILTLKSSFFGQTDINNERLKYYIENNSPYGNKESWIEFGLNDTIEHNQVSYSMSWVISDTTLRSMAIKMERPTINRQVKKVVDLTQ